MSDERGLGIWPLLPPDDDLARLAFGFARPTEPEPGNPLDHVPTSGAPTERPLDG